MPLNMLRSMLLCRFGALQGSIVPLVVWAVAFCVASTVLADKNAAPRCVVPTREDIRLGENSMLAATFTDEDPADSIQVNVTGLPSGLVAVSGTQTNGTRQIRVYGMVDPRTTRGIHPIEWRVSDGTASVSATTELRVMDPRPSTSEYNRRLNELVLVKYQHGMPRRPAYALGRNALPRLVRLLREDQCKPYWSQIAAAIGCIGDTAYFDTLHAFIWKRFQGPLDNHTWMAVRQAQVSLNVMAIFSRRVLKYLEETAVPEGWKELPWSERPYSQEELHRFMAKESVIALSFTDSEQASRILEKLDLGAKSPDSLFLHGARGMHDRVRERGMWVQDR